MTSPVLYTDPVAQKRMAEERAQRKNICLRRNIIKTDQNIIFYETQINRLALLENNKDLINQLINQKQNEYNHILALYDSLFNK